MQKESSAICRLTFESLDLSSFLVHI